MQLMKNKLTHELYQYSQNMNVLYAEDENLVAEEITEMLKIYFKDVHTVSNGLEAIIKFKENKKIDLIITDIIMPIKNGIELIRDIRKIDSSIPIIVISASTDSDYLIDAIKLNVNGYIIKPLSYEQFIKVIYSAVQKFILKKENDDYKLNLEKKVVEKTLELENRYYYDSVTELKNRNSILLDIKKYKPNKLSIIDINNFSGINDLYGYKAGDLVVNIVKKRLLSVSNSECDLYRISADQFVFMELENNQSMNCDDFVKKIQSIIHDYFINITIDEIEIEIAISVTIGISKGIDFDTILESADMALQYAKKTKQPYVLFQDKLRKIINHKKQFDAIKLIKKALVEDRVVAFYQPILKSYETTYEALVRIIDEDGRVISPFVFLDEIKHTSYYIQLTKTMIRKSFENFKNTQHSFSINLSFEDISNINLVKYLKEQIEKFDISSQLIVEILESESIDNFVLVKEFIRDMKALHVRIAIDDFGSGYSNFSYILEFEPDYLKIDGSIIKHIDTNHKYLAVAKTIVEFANELNIKTIAEYIHNKEIFDIVESLGIDGKQGYFIGEPKQVIEELI